MLAVIILIFSGLSSCFIENQKSSIIRIALFNVWELSTVKITDVDKNGVGQNVQLKAAAQIIQKIKPDLLIINEIDHDYESLDQGLEANINRFQMSYLVRGSDGISYPYIYTAPCNTGIPTGLDLSKDGIIAGKDDVGSRAYGGDCYGYGTYPGQYSMGLLSKYPIDTLTVRTFQKFLWKDLPGHHMPPGFYDDDAVEIFRLSSKSHWDIPIFIGKKRIHLFLSHPTPQAFDGEEDRNGRRNFDEIKFWIHYLENDSSLYDDNGHYGGYNKEEFFIIAGDLNAPPDSDSRYDNQVAIEQLLNHPEIKDTGKWLVSNGALQGRTAGPPHYPERNTAKFSQDFQTRIDYLLVSKEIVVTNGGVYWPSSTEDPEGNRLAEEASDHRLVWIDAVIP